MLVASPSGRQSGELVMKAEAMLGVMGISTGRCCCRTVSLLLIDEAAQVEEAMYLALRPMLAVSNGDLWLMSTPFGKQGFFYERWAHGGPGCRRFSVKATECPRIGAEFLEEERRELGAAFFGQEYMGEFVDNGSAVFRRDLVEAALDDDVEPLWE